MILYSTTVRRTARLSARPYPSLSSCVHHRALHCSSTLRQAVPPQAPGPEPSASTSTERPSYFAPPAPGTRRSEVRAARAAAGGPGKPPSRHLRFYTDILPPMLRVLGYGSAAYFGLHLAWALLDGEETGNAEEGARKELEDAIRRVREGVVGGGEAQKGSGGGSWFGWLWGSGKK